MSQEQRYASLQILRGLAAWTVVFHHYMQWYFNFQGTTFVGLFFSRYGSMGVDVFFIISGFVIFIMAEKLPDGPGLFFINRIFRIVPIYWFYCCMIVICINVFPRGFDYTSFNWKTLIATFTFLPSWNPSGVGLYPVLTVGWTLNYEMFFYTLLTICLFISKRYFFPIIAILLALLPFIYPKGAYYSQIAGSTSLWEFLAGCFLAIMWRKPLFVHFVAHYRKLMTITCMLLFAVAIFLLLKFGAKLPVAFVTVIITLFIEQYLRQDSNIVRWLVKRGDESYSTYLAHGIVLGILVHLTGKNLDSLAQIAVLLSYTIGVYMVSVASYAHLERNRYLTLLRKHVELYVVRKNLQVL